jgi:hypothetical protein
MSETCESCRFSHLLNEKDSFTGKTYPALECRRYAPRHISGVGTGYEENLWPRVKFGDWCGEWTLDESYKEVTE